MLPAILLTVPSLVDYKDVVFLGLLRTGGWILSAVLPIRTSEFRSSEE